MLLKNKIAAINGGGRGIGRSIAMRFAREGADVALIARTTCQIDQVASDVQNLGGNAFAVPAGIPNEWEIFKSEIGSDQFNYLHMIVSKITLKRPL